MPDYVCYVDRYGNVIHPRCDGLVCHRLASLPISLHYLPGQLDEWPVFRVDVMRKHWKRGCACIVCGGKTRVPKRTD